MHKEEYLNDIWKLFKPYQLAYKLWIKYNYECERYDESVCTGGRDDYGFFKPLNSYELAKINQFAFHKRNEIIEESKMYEIPYKDMEDAKKEVNRLNLNGLIKEYNRLYRNER